MTSAVVEQEGAEAAAPPLARMGIAVLALVGIFVSGYLTLYHFGFLGVIQCSVGGCEVVQASPWAYFPPRHLSTAGVPVALLGLMAYAVLFAIALLGVLPRFQDQRWIAIGIFVVAAVGVAFSGWLTYLEAAVIGAWCQWCVISAVLITLIFLFSIPGLRRAR